MDKGNQMQKIDVDKVISEIEEKIAELEGLVPEQQIRLMKEELNLIKVRKERYGAIILEKEDSKFVFEYGEINLNNLIITNDIKLFEELKAQDNVGILFEPEAIRDFDFAEKQSIYLIGISKDK